MLKDDKSLKDFKQGCGMIRFTFKIKPSVSSREGGLIQEDNSKEREKG